MRCKVQAVVLNPALEVEPQSGGKEEGPKPPTALAQRSGDEEEESEERQRERAVLAEIDKFRVRQQVRDKEAEEKQRVRLQARLRQLAERQVFIHPITG